MGGVSLRSFWGQSGMILGPFLDHSGVILRSSQKVFFKYFQIFSHIFLYIFEPPPGKKSCNRCFFKTVFKHGIFENTACLKCSFKALCNKSSRTCPKWYLDPQGISDSNLEWKHDINFKIKHNVAHPSGCLINIISCLRYSLSSCKVQSFVLFTWYWASIFWYGCPGTSAI